MATAGSEMLPRHAISRGRAWGLFAGFIGVCVISAAIADWRERHMMMINSSDSLPNWAFLIERGATPHRGDYVFFEPPTIALIRRHFGNKPRLFGKIVYGMPGDVVAHRGPSVIINGRSVATMKPRTRLGEALTPGKTGVIPAGCYYAGTPHPDGFDSRYSEIGFVCGRQIVGTGEALL